MVRTIETALQTGPTDESVDLVLIDGAGDRAFCAGGDIAAIYADGKARATCAGPPLLARRIPDERG